MAIIFSKVAKLPTKFGDFKIVAFKNESDQEATFEHLVIFTNYLENNPLVRIHSECLTGDALGSYKCDCGPELAYSLEAIAKNKKGGMVIYLRQEGRGIGLFNKVNAYSFQDEGFDTVQANLAVGKEADERNYEILKSVFDYFKIDEIELLTNNPLKIEAIKPYLKNVSRREIIKGVNKHNEEYLKIKKEKMGHMF